MTAIDLFHGLNSWSITRVAELSIAIICSCLPVTTPVFRKHNLVFLPLAKFKSTLSFQNSFHRRKNRSAKTVRLETSILGSALGDGKFLKSDDLSLHTSSFRNEEIGETKDSTGHLGVWLEPSTKSFEQHCRAHDLENQLSCSRCSGRRAEKK